MAANSLEMNEHNKFLQKYLDCLKEENSKMESICEKLGIQIEILDEISTKYGSSPILRLNVMERQRKLNNYISKIKLCTKIYDKSNDVVLKEIDLIKTQVKNSVQNINNLQSMSEAEIKALELRLQEYENHLQKFEQKYPWINNRKLNLLQMKAEIDLLKRMQVDKDVLEKELEQYHDLKPDLSGARKQLADIKSEFKDLTFF